MMKLYTNQTAENTGVRSARTLAILFDGVARYTQEGLDFVRLAQERGFREAVRQRDEPFADYGSASRSRRRRSKRSGRERAIPSGARRWPRRGRPPTRSAARRR